MFIRQRSYILESSISFHRVCIVKSFSASLVRENNLSTTLEDNLKDLFIRDMGVKNGFKRDESHFISFGIYKPQAIYLRYSENENGKIQYRSSMSSTTKPIQQI